jgi:Flp pilus assembly secretin CpaC
MRPIRLLFLAAGAVLAGMSAASAQGISVALDEVTLVAFPQPVATVYLGNSSIADLTLLDARHVFVLGKSFGSTNLIALSADKTVVSNEQVTVLGQRVGAVTLNRGADTYNFACTSQRCETRPLPGDAKAFFDNAMSETNAHVDQGNKSAQTGMQSQH